MKRTSPDLAPYDAMSAAQKYLPLMLELGTRLELVADAYNGNLGLKAPFAREFAYFQFRRMCELIALGALTLHGDLPGTKTRKIQTEWSADRILHMLHGQRAVHFPQPAIVTPTANGVHIEGNANPDALTQAEFKRLYAECGEALHRGSIRALEGERAFTVAQYERVDFWQRKIVALMSVHIVAHVECFFLVRLRTESGFPSVELLNHDGPGAMNVRVCTMRLADRNAEPAEGASPDYQLRYFVETRSGGNG